MTTAFDTRKANPELVAAIAQDLADAFSPATPGSPPVDAGDFELAANYIIGSNGTSPADSIPVPPVVRDAQSKTAA